LRSYRDLEAWRLSLTLVADIYRVTAKFPTSEDYGPSQQIRRAAVSIPSNIAEGQFRNSPKEFRQFLSVALGAIGRIRNSVDYCQ
jgi:four helix bundle protein